MKQRTVAMLTVAVCQLDVVDARCVVCDCANAASGNWEVATEKLAHGDISSDSVSV